MMPDSAHPPRLPLRSPARQCILDPFLNRFKVMVPDPTKHLGQDPLALVPHPCGEVTTPQVIEPGTGADQEVIPTPTRPAVWRSWPRSMDRTRPHESRHPRGDALRYDRSAGQVRAWRNAP